MRLNKDIKSKIIENALKKAGIDGSQEDLLKIENDLAEKIRVYAIGGSDFEKKAKKAESKIREMRQENPAYFSHYMEITNKRERIGISINSCHVSTLSFSELKVISRDTIKLNSNNSDEEDIIDQVRVLDKRKSDLDSLRNEIIDEVSCRVNGVSTIKKLIESWPECVDILPEINQKSGLPAMNNNNINKILGLKK